MFTIRLRQSNIHLISPKFRQVIDASTALEELERDSTLADLLKEAEQKKEELIKFLNEGDGIKINRALSRFADHIKKIAPKNASDRKAILGLINSVPENTDANFTRDLTALRAQYAKNYEDIDKKEAATKAPTVKDTNKSLSRNFEAIVQKNSRDAQAKDFTEYVGEKLIGVVKTDFLDAFKKIDQNNTETVSYELTSVSIPNLLRSLSEGTVYIADGAEWNDRPIVKKFLEIYAKHKAVLDPILSPLIAANRAGQSVESVKKSGTLKTNPNNVDIIAHLTQIDNFNTYGTTGLDRQLAAGVAITLDKVKGDDEKFLSAINAATTLGGRRTLIENMADLKGKLVSDPTFKYTILAGFREAARLPGGVNSMLDAKNASGIGESERKVLESIIKDKVKLIDGLKSGFDKQLEKQIKDGTIPADKKAEAQKAIDAYTADLKKDGSVGWNIISKNLGGFITNNGVALGGGVTFDLPANFLADNVNLGFGYSKSGGFGVGITFDKAITKDTKLLYGWAGAPFIGMTTQFEKWQFTGIAGVGGGMIDVTLQMGNKDLELGRMEAMKSAEKILSQIDKLTSETLPEKIVFTADVSSYPKTSTDPMEMTQDRAQKLNDAINTDIQNRLIIAGYGKEQNPIVRSQMIYNALSQGVNARTNLIGLDDATGGWSFKSLGLTLGSFVGVPFIIPHASISRTTYAETARVERSKETIVGKPEKLDWNTLFEVPKVNSDGTYTLKLKKHSPLSFNEIEVSLPNGAKFENGEIVGLKDFGVKVLREPTGKYNVSYSTVPVLKVGAMPDRGIDVTLDRVESIKDALNIQKIRVQLSTLLTSWSPLKPKMNDWANAMDAFERTSTGDIAALKKQLLAIFNTDRKNTGLVALGKTLETVTDPKQLQSALFDIRGAAMMDVDQARRGANFNKPHKPAEGESTTRQRWIEMLKKLPQNAGITPDDYKDIIPDTYTQAGNKIGDIEKGMIGAVASLKTDPPRFALMPSGTMRIAGDGTNNFMKEVSAPDKKTAIFDTVLPETSRSTDILRTNIAKALNLKPVQVTYTHLKNLLVSGSAVIEGKTVNMKGAKFALCAYGDCTNQGMGLIPGKISVDGKPEVSISAESLSSSVVERLNLRSGASTSEVGLMGGAVGVGRDSGSRGATSTPGSPNPEPSTQATSLPGQGTATQGNSNLVGGTTGTNAISGASLGGVPAVTVVGVRGGTSGIPATVPANGVLMGNPGVTVLPTGPANLPAPPIVRGAPAPTQNSLPLGPTVATITAIDNLNSAK